MPSPTSTTVPTLRVSTPASNESIADLMMLVISSERMAIGVRSPRGRPHELVPQPLEAAPDAAVDQAVADPDDEAAEQAGIDLDVELDAAAGELLESRREGRGPRPSVSGAALVAVAWMMPCAAVVEPAELGGDARQLLDPAAPEQAAATRLSTGWLAIGPKIARPTSARARRAATAGLASVRPTVRRRRRSPRPRRARAATRRRVPSRAAISKAASA